MLNISGPDIEAIDNLEIKINELEKQLAAKAKDNQLKVTRWQDVQQCLQPDQAAVEIIRFHLYDKQWKDTVRYAALVLTPQLKQPQVVVLPHGNLMEARGTQGYRAAVAALRGVGVEPEEESTMPADSLYRLFWQPIQQTLDSLGGFRTVYLSPGGAFHQINLLTLPHPKGGYLADVMDLRIVGSTRDLVQPHKLPHCLASLTMPPRPKPPLMDYWLLLPLRAMPLTALWNGRKTSVRCPVPKRKLPTSAASWQVKTLCIGYGSKRKQAKRRCGLCVRRGSCTLPHTDFLKPLPNSVPSVCRCRACRANVRLRIRICAAACTWQGQSIRSTIASASPPAPTTAF